MKASIDYVESKYTKLGYFAFRYESAKEAYQNKMDVETMVELCEDDVVVDIGAYVGEYSLFAMANRVKKVISYEPTPKTFELLKLNRYVNFPLHENWEIINKAVVNSNDETIKLHLNNGIGLTNSITKGNGDSIVVPAISYKEAVKDATVVKIDVEGAEYDFDIIQPSLKAIIVEFHSIEHEDWINNAENIMDEIEAANFFPVMKPAFTNDLDMHGAWIRYV